jgi:uncharacterized protein (TIGR02001 family)
MVAALIMVAALAAPAMAEVAKTASASASVMSNYVWRGLKLSDSWVIQPSATVGIDAFSFNMWSNVDMEKDTGFAEDTIKMTETDLTLGYSKTLAEKWGLGAGYIYYGLEGLNDTQEIYVSASYNWTVTPSLTWYYDFDEGTGSYILLKLAYAREVATGISLSTYASASYLVDNNVVGVDADGEEYSNFHNGEVGVGLNIPVGIAVITPTVAYTFPLSDDCEDAAKAYSFDQDEEIFYGGVTASVSF